MRVVSTFPSPLPVGGSSYRRCSSQLQLGARTQSTPPPGVVSGNSGASPDPGKVQSTAAAHQHQLGPWFNREPRRWTPPPSVRDRAGFTLLGETNKQG